MRRLVLACLFAITSWLVAESASAGLTVTFTANGNQIASLSGSDTNDPNTGGMVARTGLAVNIDQDPFAELAVQTLEVTSAKTATQGTITTINLSIANVGSEDIAIEILARDLFGIPASSPGDLFGLRSTIVSSILPVGRTLDVTTSLDGQTGPTASAAGPGNLVPIVVSSAGNTLQDPFELESLIEFTLGGGQTVQFTVESAAIVPEVASIVAWSLCLGVGLMFYRRRT